MVNDPYENSAARTGLVNHTLSGRYEVLEMLGEGPLLTAYRARDKQVNRIVTIKVVKPEFARNKDVLQSLRDGIGQAYSLAHSGIARVFDVATDEETGLLFLAEEYVRGIDLKERIRRTAPFQLAAATDTAIAVAEALEAAHSRGIAHGDVRPQNVLIGPEGQTKLTNFGISEAQAKVAADDPALLKRIVGYSAPDAARVAAPTASADLYGLGCILFEMLTGDLPYTGDNPIQIALKHAQEPIPSPRQINGNIPPALDGIVKKVLEKTPQTRYASASEMLIDLKAVRDGLRFGKSLNWTPKERENSADRMAAPATYLPPPTDNGNGANTQPSVLPTVARGATSGNAAVTTSVMPTQGVSGKVATARVSEPAADPIEEEVVVRPVRAKGVQWLTLLNLFMALLLVGACAGFYWVVISSNRPDEVVVLPSLVGKTVTEAEEMAKQKGFKIAVVSHDFREEEPKDVIYRQDITPGRSIKPGKQVPVWVSDGPRMVTVPDVREVAVERAQKMLERDGLRVGSVKPEYDPLAPKGNVINQTPPPGENKPRGTKIDLVISKGEEPPPPEPSPTPESIPAADPNAFPTAPPPDATPGEQPTPAATAGTPRTRYYKVVYPQAPIPAGDEPHHIRIDVLDDDGPHLVKNATINPGEQLRIERVKVVGDKFTIKVYDNDQLKGEIKSDDLPGKQ